MTFKIVNFRTNDSESASQHRWQQVLDLGCPVEERGQRVFGQPGPSPAPIFEAMP